MKQTTIFLPFLSVVLLTFGVWVYMYARRLAFIFGNRIDTKRLTTPEKAGEIIPEEIQWASHNLRNLFEVPVLFYAMCLYLYVTGSVDWVHVAAAWLFVAFRAAHSVIHCWKNIVKARFASYMLASLALWFIVFRAAADVLAPAS